MNIKMLPLKLEKHKALKSQQASCQVQCSAPGHCSSLHSQAQFESHDKMNLK